MKHRIFLILALTSIAAIARDPVESVEPDPMGGGNPVATNSPTSTSGKEIPAADPMGGATAPASDTTANQAHENVSESSTPSEPMGGTVKESASKPATEKKHSPHPNRHSPPKSLI